MVAMGEDGLLKEYIERLYGICPNITYMDFLVDGNLSVVSKFLLERGYVAKPYYTQIVDLTRPEEELRANLRKSYKSLVNKTPIISILDDITPLKNLHRQVRGIRRNDESWFIQQKMIWQKQAFAMIQSRFKSMTSLAPDNTITEAGALIYYNDYTSYYGVGCSVEGVGSHALLWSAIMHAKKLGCKTFEMGEQVWGDNKEAQIAKFKRGFGGQTKVRLILEK